MTICTLGAASAAPRNIHSDSFRVRTLMLGLLLSSVATAAIAQDASPAATFERRTRSRFDQHAAARADQLERDCRTGADRACAAGR